MIFLLIIGTVGLAAFLGYLTGVRVQRGRAERIEELRAEQNPPERRGVRLRSIRVTR